MTGRRLHLLADVPVDAAALARLRETGRFEIDLVDEPAETSRPLDAERLRKADAIFCTFLPSNFGEATRVRWVQIASTGYSQLFGHRLVERGIRATNARGCFDVPIGEWTVAMMVNLVRDVRQMIRNQEAAAWDRSARFQRELRGMTVGLWGYGGIGREVARLSKQLGLRVHVLTRGGTVTSRQHAYTVPGTGDPEGALPDRVFGEVEALDFLRALHFLVVAVPLTSATEDLIGERELRAMSPSAFLLNPARGPIVNQEALRRALSEGWIAGAALDTHYDYPTPPDSPFWRMPNVVFTPHIAGSSLGPNFLPRLWDIFSTNTERFAAEMPLLNELSPRELSGQ